MGTYRASEVVSVPVCGGCRLLPVPPQRGVAVNQARLQLVGQGGRPGGAATGAATAISAGFRGGGSCQVGLDRDRGRGRLCPLWMAHGSRPLPAGCLAVALPLGAAWCQLRVHAFIALCLTIIMALLYCKGGNTKTTSVR